MVVVDWLQACEFLRENADRFILYALCGGLIGLVIILLTIILVLYIEIRFQSDSDDDSSSVEPDYELNRTYLPVYRYNDRIHQDFYQLSS